LSVPPASRSAKRKAAPKSRRRFLSTKRILLALLGLFLLGVAAFGVAYATIRVPLPNDLANAQTSIIYYADGTTEMDRISDVNRQSVPLTEIPVYVQHEVLAAEDRTFYQNNGVSPSGIARAVVVALQGGPTQGGSTITQQYVKNYFLTSDRTISRKARELIISLKIDQEDSKNTILANYLNTIYYGRGAYGIQTAARAYFGVDSSKLNLAQGALLASVIRGPQFYDPALGATAKASAVARVNYVLDGMVTQGWLSPEVRAKTTFPRTIAPARTTSAGTVGYITSEVKRELTGKLHLSSNDIDRGGLRIVTTIEQKAQDSAVKAVADNLPPERDAAALHVGLTAIRPGDGAIVAMYGGQDYSKIQLNSSTDAKLQGGSTFKVFGLLAALQHGISTKRTYDGYSPQFFPQFVGGANPSGRVQNFANEQFGRIDLRTALAQSVNTVFAQLNIDLAAPGTSATRVRNAAILAGVPSNTAGLGTDMTNIFGTASPHVIDMANAFATIAAQGVRATPYLISKVTSVSGSINYSAAKQLAPVFDQKVTADVTEAMTHVVSEGTGSGALALGRPAAGKTGTSSENKAVWFDGFTPQLAAAVGIYQGDGTHQITVSNFGEVTGGTYPVKIWTAFMQGALAGEKVMDFPPRVGVGDNALPRPTSAPATPAPAPPVSTTPARTNAPTTAPTSESTTVPTTVPTTARTTVPTTVPTTAPTRHRRPGNDAPPAAPLAPAPPTAQPQ
jgi:membrane peptidoglycan carboxypeptidase